MTNSENIQEKGKQNLSTNLMTQVAAGTKKPEHPTTVHLQQLVWVMLQDVISRIQATSGRLNRGLRNAVEETRRIGIPA